MLFYYRLSTYSKKLQRKSCKHGRIHTCFQGSKLCIQYALTIQTNTRFPIRKAVSFACQIHTIFCKLKFIYSEKATKFCEISTLDLTVCSTVKYKVEISQNFVAFSEYMNFIHLYFVSAVAFVGLQVSCLDQIDSYEINPCIP